MHINQFGFTNILRARVKLLISSKAGIISYYIIPIYDDYEVWQIFFRGYPPRREIIGGRH